MDKRLMNSVIEKPSAQPKPISVLIVEDELIAAENISRNLKKQGYQVTAIVDSGEEAIQLAIANQPDLVLMDIMLQGDMDGIQAAERINHQLNIPLIYMTAYGDDTTLERAKKTNPSGYIVKPFKPQNLKIAIEVALQSDRIQRQQKKHLAQQLQQAEQQLQTHALREPLTQLPNRRALQEPFSSLIRQLRQQHPHHTNPDAKPNSILPVLCLKIEHWQRINAYFGYQKSDELLNVIARRIAQQFDGRIELAYLNAAEFAILIAPTSNKHLVLQQAQQLLHLFQVPFSLDKQPLCLSASIGIALYPHDGQALDDLLKLSRSALSIRKTPQTQPSITFYSDQTVSQRDNVSLQELELENDLRQALIQRELQIHYQPVVLIQTGKIVGAEALLRWHHPRHGWISPEHFIPIAEKYGLMPQIGLWLTEQVCCYQNLLLSYGFDPIRISINLSPSQFFQQTLSHDLLKIFVENQVDPHLFELEITEDIVIKDFVWSERQMKALKRIGLSIAMDDLGKGQSSLIYLQRLPFDVIKVDRDFIRNIHQKPTNQAIVKALISMAHQLKMKVIAEGVETREELTMLQAFQSDYVQGYLMGRPVSGDKFRYALMTHKAQQGNS
jgi:diguanylate cyclase (GGDEF)-like protein